MLTAIRKVEIGEKIRVKGYHRLLKETETDNLQNMSNNIPRGFNDTMKELCGRIVTVAWLGRAMSDDGGQRIAIDKDSSGYYWNSFMFTEIEDDAWDWSENDV